MAPPRTRLASRRIQAALVSAGVEIDPRDRNWLLSANFTGSGDSVADYIFQPFLGTFSPVEGDTMGSTPSTAQVGKNVRAKLYGIDAAGTLQPFRAAVASFDAEVSAQVSLSVKDFLYGMNAASSFDRLRAFGDNTDAVAVDTLGRLLTASRLYGFNGLTWDRIRSDASGRLRVPVKGLDAGSNEVFVGANPPVLDALSPFAIDAAGLATRAFLYGFNGATLDRIRALADNAANPSLGKIPTLPARANAVAPAWTEGAVVPLSVDLGGTLRTTAGAGGGFVPYTRQAAWDGVYSFQLVDQAGVAAANNFLSLFNPAASGKVVILLEASVESYSVAIAATKNSMRLTRITAASVGTLQAATAINKFQTSDPNPASEVRTGNPTITAAAEVDAFGPNEVITAAGSNAISRRKMELRPEWGEFTLIEGQGVAFRQTIAGDVDQTWNLKLSWVER